MSIPETETISALAVLRPRDQPGEPPSVENLERWAPAPGTAEAATALLRQFGFTVEASGPAALRITGRAGLFQTVFRAVLARTGRGGVVVEGGSPDLPLDALPPSVRSLLMGVGFEQPPEFGPGEFA